MGLLDSIGAGKHNGIPYHRLSSKIGANSAIKLKAAGLISGIDIRQATEVHLTLFDTQRNSLGSVMLQEQHSFIGSGNHAIQIGEVTAVLQGQRQSIKIPDRILEIEKMGEHSYELRNLLPGNEAFIQIHFNDHKLESGESIEVGRGGELRIIFVDHAMKDFPVGIVSMQLTIPQPKREVVRVGARNIRPMDSARRAEVEAALRARQRDSSTRIGLFTETTIVDFHLPLEVANVQITYNPDINEKLLGISPNQAENEYFLMSADRKSLYRMVKGQSMSILLSREPKQSLSVFFDPANLSMKVHGSRGDQQTAKPFVNPELLLTSRVMFTVLHDSRRVTYEIVYGSAALLNGSATIEDISALLVEPR